MPNVYIIMCKREDWTDFLINYVAATRFNYRDAHGRVLAASSSDIDEIMLLLLLLLFYIFLSTELGTDSDRRLAYGHRILSSSPVVSILVGTRRTLRNRY